VLQATAKIVPHVWLVDAETRLVTVRGDGDSNSRPDDTNAILQSPDEACSSMIEPWPVIQLRVWAHTAQLPHAVAAFYNQVIQPIKAALCHSKVLLSTSASKIVPSPLGESVDHPAFSQL